MSNVKSGIGLKSYEWSSLELLKGLSIEQIKSNPSKPRSVGLSFGMT